MGKLDEGRSLTPAFAWQTRPVAECSDGEREWSEYETDFLDASVTQLELSGTGFESEVLAAVHEYLTFIDHHVEGRRNTLFSAKEHMETSWDAAADQWFYKFCLAAELANRAGFTEYGTSLRTAWVDETGKAWMADYEKWKAEQKP